MGCRKEIHGERLLVADRWIKEVLEVKCASERLLVVPYLGNKSPS